MADTLGVRRNEGETLGGFLDWYRAVVERKVEGLTLDQARTARTTSGLSPLGVVKHLAWVELGWFREIFAGEEVDRFDGEGDNSAEFALDADDTVDFILAFYRTEVDNSRRVVAESSSLEDLSAKATKFRGHVSLRWILVHMLEETARHAAHLDLMRETIDGKTGD